MLRLRLSLGTCALLAFAIASTTACEVQAQSLTDRAALHKPMLVREAKRIWGIEAPVATFAAQIHQESAWRSNVSSHAGAQGLAQFMPATAKWMGELDYRLTTADSFNPRWAIRAMLVYDKWLSKRVDSIDDCNRFAFTLSAYNGGLGWVYKDKRLAVRNGYANDQYWGHVERFNAGRSKGNFKENRDYPRRIIYTHQPKYDRWGLGVCK